MFASGVRCKWRNNWKRFVVITLATIVKEAVLNAAIASRNRGWNLPDDRLRDSSLSANLPLAHDQFRYHMAFQAIDLFDVK